ncbi:unnamed protein product [Prorocentrum cordatum]|uniref:Uncharacterized protein n=1 Tax=Prorocentrum cordatum TaxID=2364126 RepID=A0ABN9VP73_9DINO|nr:unnamed protein product [Polarella glacialis]
MSSMGAGVQTQFTCEDACVQTQFTSMDAGVHTQFTLKDAGVQTQFTFQDDVKTWIDRSTAQKGFTGQIALQYEIQGLELFVDLMTEPMTIPKHHVSFWFHTLFNLTDGSCSVVSGRTFGLSQISPFRDGENGPCRGGQV